MKQAKIATIVVNWNLKEETLRCLQSLESINLPSNYAHRVIVVDNGSGDGSKKCIARQFPEFEIISLPSNIGFGAACNQAISWVMNDTLCEYMFLLNNDAFAHPNVLSELIQVAEANPEAGILGPKIYYQDEPRTIWYAGARKRWGVMSPMDTGRGEIDYGQFNVLREVDYVFGAAMFIRRSVFEKVGLFDEKFFIYLEDMDLCLRAKEIGFSLLFVPQAYVWHKGSASTTSNAGMREYHLIRSAVYFAMKHTMPALIIPSLFLWIPVLLRLMANSIIRGDIKALESYWSGLLDGLETHIL
jgi:hypothetical protein